jgi:hypothetical protein
VHLKKNQMWEENKYEETWVSLKHHH